MFEQTSMAIAAPILYPSCTSQPHRDHRLKTNLAVRLQHGSNSIRPTREKAAAMSEARVDRAQINHLSVRLILAVGLAVAFMIPTSVNADDFSWTVGNGSFYNAANWNPFGIPTFGDSIRIGNLVGVQNSTVTMGGGNLSQSYSYLEVSSGMTLNATGTQLSSPMVANITGNNSRILISTVAAGPNPYDFQSILQVGTGSRFEITNNASSRLLGGSQSSGDIRGRGSILIDSHIPFINNGTIRPDNNGGLVITQGNGMGTLHGIDLDGTTNNGHLFLHQQFSVLEVNASHLTDSFSGMISFMPGSLLTMNITDGWSADANSLITANGIGEPNNWALIGGSPWTFGGTMNVGGNQGRLRVLSDVTYAPTASVNIGSTDGVQMTGTTTVQGGQFSMGQGAILAFDGATNMQGGTFTTHSNDFADGFVAFNGPTNWRGTTTINGVARQNGTATVNAATGGVINANVFDMDGAANNTTWNINSSLVVNADRISATPDNRFAGTMNIAGGFTGKLTMNVGGDVASRWIMAGEMNLAGQALSPFPVDRLAGSAGRGAGGVHVHPRGRGTANAEFTESSSLNFASPTSLVQFTGDTRIDGATSVSGMGTLENGMGGSMQLGNGLMLGQAGLNNRGLLQIGDSPGVISVDRFENFDTGIWLVEIGGLLAGTEHDLMIVGGGQTFLDGFLEVDLIDLGLGSGLFIPSIGDTFTILASLGGVDGMFLNNPVTTLGPQQFHWDVIYNPHDVQLQLASVSIPEPSAALLTTVFGLGLLMRRRSRSNCHQSADVGRVKNAILCGAVVSRQGSGNRSYGHGTWLCSLIVGLLILHSGTNVACAQPIHWASGSGNWWNAANWTPIGIPGPGNQVWIGSIAGVENHAMFIGQETSINSLVISNGNLLANSLDCCGNDVVGHLLSVSANTAITSGAGINIYNNPGANGFNTNNLTLVGQNSRFSTYGSTARINGILNVGEGSRLTGTGSIELFGNGTTLINDGSIQQGPGFRQIRQRAGGVFDLDGVSNNGTISVGSSADQQATLSILHGGLTDSFSGTINLLGNAYLNMEVESWTADASSQIAIYDHGTSIAHLGGDPVTLAGQVQVNNVWSGSEFRIIAAATLASTLDFSMNNGGTTTFWHVNNSGQAVTTTIQGGNYQLGHQSQLVFNAATTVSGGNFVTAGDTINDGVVLFNGPTHWNGSVDIQGSARQIGNATTNGATINANLLDMSGNGGTEWNINGLTTINAGQIDVSGANVFTGTMNVGSGFTSRLTLNLNDPDAHWTMAGQMNLTGNALSPFPIDRLHGSAVRVEGELNVNHQVRIAAPTTFASGSTTHFQTPLARLQTSQFAAVEAGAQFSGGGTLENGLFGTMMLHDGAVLNDVGLTNHGTLEIGELTGVATVDRFEMSSTGVWNIEVGGYLAGVEFDRLLVSGMGGATLDGTLNVELIDLGGGVFLPEIGDEFSILFSFAGINGMFMGDPTSQVGSQLFHWETIYNPHDVRLRLASVSAIPEPSSTMLLGLFLLASCLRRRSR